MRKKPKQSIRTGGRTARTSLVLFFLSAIFLYQGSFGTNAARAALQYVGGASGTGTAATYNVSLTALTGGIGSAAAAGDLVVVVTGWASTTDGLPGVTTAGYTEEANLYMNDTRDANLSVSWKIMGGTPDTLVTVSGSGSGANGGATVVHVWRGADQATPMDVAVTTATSNNAAQPNSPSITPATSGAYVLTAGLGTGDTTPTAFTVPAGYGNGLSVPGAGTTMSAIAVVASIAWSSGAEDPAAWGGGETTTSDSWVAATLAIRPAPTAPGASLLHNSDTTGSAKWSGSWGVAGGKYGEFACETCHIDTTTNIKMVKDTVITAPNSPVDQFPGEVGSIAPLFTRVSGALGNTGVMGDDSGNSPRASSNRICEVCHTYDATQANGVNAHPYSVGSALPNHKGADAADCTSCHKHNMGFKASCDTCHGYPPTISTPGGPDGLADNNGASPGGTTGSTTPGAHGAHVNTGSIACASCHYNSSGQGTTHNNGDLNVTMGFYLFGGAAQGGAYDGQTTANYNATTTTPATTVSKTGNKTCTTVYCHGGSINPVASPVWDGSVACGTNCHKATNADPPTLVNHPRHAGQAAGQMNLACTKCHPARTIGWDGHVDASVQWDLDRTDAKIGSSATYRALELGSTGTKAPSSPYGSCNNIYCHSIVQTTSGGALTPDTSDYKQPTWGDTTPLTCTSCHGNPSASGGHVKHTAGNPGNYVFVCADCHNGQVPPSSSVHVNGSVNTSIATTWGTATYNGTAAPADGFSTCSNTYCHSNGIGGTTNAGETRTVQANTSPTWSGGTACYSCHGDGVSSSRPNYPNNDAGYQNKKNSHQLAKHSSLSCDKCHYNTTKDGATIADADRANHVNRLYNVNGTGSVPYTFTYAYNVSGGSCSTSYCHGTSAIAWGTTGTLTCNSCHQSQGGDNSTLASRFAPKHEKHTSTNYYTFSCEMCHALGNTTNGNVSHTGGPATGGTNPGGDVAGSNQTGEIRFRDNGATWATGAYNGSAVTTYRYRTLYASPFGAAAPTPTYVDGTASGTDTVNGSITYTTTGSSCGTVWCHSNANPVLRGAETNRNSYKAVAWNATTVCTTCHRGPETYANMAPGSPTDQLSTTHAIHAATDKYGFTCDECHADTIANDSTGTLNASTGYANHVDGTKSWKFSTTLRSTAVSQANGTYAGGGGACANIYCHSRGTVLSGGTYNQGTNTPLTSPTWTLTSLNCGGCHDGTTTGPVYPNGTPKTNSHNKHVVTKGYGCVDCHSATVDGTNAITTQANHVNASYNVAGARISSYTYLTDGGTCSTNCHASTTPKWGQTSSGCTFCHPTLSGKHSSHVIYSDSSVYGSTSANVSGSTTNYDFGCGNCHPVLAANHNNGTLELSLNPADGGALKSKNSSPSIAGSGLTTQCNGVYCHSDGKSSPAFVQTPQWQSSYASSWNTCGNCHGNSPSGTNHAKHVVGIHYQGIYTGTIGLQTAGTASTNSHGSGTYSTTINCNVCHNSTVTKSRNKYGAACNTAGCHQADADNTTNAMVTADTVKTFHVNGQPDLAFQSVQVKSKAQLRDDIAAVTELNNSWSRPASSYKTGSTPNDTAKNALNTGSMWNGVSKTCSNIACHNSNSVTWNSTVSCNSCHTALP